MARMKFKNSRVQEKDKGNDCAVVVVVVAVVVAVVVLWGQFTSTTTRDGAEPITLQVQRVERPGLDGLITEFLLDQTIRAWSLNSLNR